MNPLLASRMSKSIPEYQNLASTLRMKNSNEVALQMAMANPTFKDFWEKNKDKSVDQICEEYNINKDLLRMIIG